MAQQNRDQKDDGGGAAETNKKKVFSGDVSGQGRDRRDDDVMKGDRSAAELGTHEGGSKRR